MASRLQTNHARQVELILQQMDSLPTLSAIVVRLLEVTADEQSDARDVIELVSADPALAGKVLRLCRCVKGGRARQITTIDRVVTMVGFDAVRSAALSVQVFELFDGVKSPGGEVRSEQPVFDREMFWRHSVAVGVAAEWLALKTAGAGKVSSGEAYICGLLHDLGVLALHVIMPRSFDRVCELAESHGLSLDHACNQVLGVDSRVAGKRLGNHWQLPRRLVDVMWLHGQPMQALRGLPHRNLIALVSLADVLVRQRYITPIGHTPRGEDLLAMCEPLGLGRDDIEQVASRLHNEVAQRAAALGLTEEPTTDSLLRSISRANQVLGHITTAMSRQALAGERRAEVLDAIAQFHEVAQAGSIERVLAGIVSSGRHILPNAQLGIVYQAAAGEPWEVLRFTDDGRLLSRKLLSPPATARPLCEIAVADGCGLRCAELAPWLESSLLEGANPADVQAITLAGGSAGAALLYDQPIAPPYTPGQFSVLHRTWEAAIEAAAHYAATETLAEQLAQANRTLADTRDSAARAQAMAALGELAAGAAHEMNNPLAVISGRSQLLVERLQDPELRSAAQQIVQRSHDLSDMITALRDVAEPAEPKPQLVDPHVVLREIVTEFSPRNDGASQIKLVVEEGVGQVLVDPDHLAKAVRELVRNAFAASSGVQIEVRVQIDPLDDRLKVQVTDNGPGLSDDALAHAFAPFFSDKPAGRQPGLGLARVRRLVEANRGRITLKNGPTGGAVATIWLPGGRAAVSSQRGAA